MIIIAPTEIADLPCRNGPAGWTRTSRLAVLAMFVACAPSAWAGNDYASQCAMCHGDPKSAGIPMSFNGKRDASTTKAAIEGGIPAMASLKSLSDTDLNSIALEMGGAADLGAPTASPAPAPTSAPLPTDEPAPWPTPEPSDTGESTDAPAPAPTPSPSAAPVPSAPPTAQVSCKGATRSARPLVYPVPEQNVTLGQTLTFVVSALDCNDVPILIKASKLKGGTMISEGQDFDDSGAWSGKYEFTPTLDQADKLVKVRFIAQQTEDSRRASLPWTLGIRVLSPDSADSDAAVTGIKLQSARWSEGALRVSGRLEFSRKIQGKDRKSISAEAEITLADSNGGELGQFRVNPDGKWSGAIEGLDPTTVPCSIEAQFNGHTDTRSVKKPPAACVN